MFKALHTLLAGGRGAGHAVCHDGERFVLWPEFAARVSAHAERFAAQPQARWLLAANSPLDFAVLLLALLHAGKQVVIPPNAQAGTLAQLGAAYDAVAEAEAGAIVHASPAPSAALDPQRAIIDLYTSGSTGEPKAIRKTLAQFETEVAVLESLWGTTLGSIPIVASAPHHHFYGLLFRLFWPLSAGRAFDNVTCAYPDTLATRMALLGDTALVSSPALLARLPQLIRLDSLKPAPRLIFSSGGPLPADTAGEFYRQLGQAPIEVFGSTETGGVAWRRQEGDDSWTPMPGIHVGSEADGALSLRSPYLLQSTPWRMDDAVELLAGHRFRLRGRLDRVVKIEEKRLSLPDLEARLAEHPWVGAAAALALPGRRQSIGAVVSLNPQGRAQLDALGRRQVGLALRRHLAAHFDAALLPRRWKFPEQLPLNERGKLTHAALSALFAGTEDDTAAP